MNNRKFAITIAAAVLAFIAVLAFGGDVVIALIAAALTYPLSMWILARAERRRKDQVAQRIHDELRR
jgi:multisubunit Na+/H+ antiporter MnhG subunit